MPQQTMITEQERDFLKRFVSLITDPNALYARTTADEVFDCHDHAAMAFLIWRRMGRNQESTGAAWRRLMQSNCPTEDVMALVAFYVFHQR